MNKAIEYALLTWYPKDHPLHLDPRHPAIKLAGEAGELLDLYGKHEYKPKFDWMNCKRCKQPKDAHFPDMPYICGGMCEYYTPFVLDELGDWSYYHRILSYINKDINFERNSYYTKLDSALVMLNSISSIICGEVVLENKLNTSNLRIARNIFEDVLSILDVELNHITELNYQKLNSDLTNHGWKGA